jgi:hypothetical protein
MQLGWGSGRGRNVHVIMMMSGAGTGMGARRGPIIVLWIAGVDAGLSDWGLVTGSVSRFERRCQRYEGSEGWESQENGFDM